MMWKTLIFLACLCATGYSAESLEDVSFDTRAQVHPDVGLRVPDLVTKYGYPIESHSITTKDNYILTLHRIPHGKHNGGEINKPVIFLMHGLLCSSADWVLMGPEKGLAYLLADMGYDVWMGNARGNTYSRGHVELSPDQDKKKFWKFSWHEIGIYDLPAMIDFVLESTKVEQVYYIGHSQGTTSFFVMTSTYPEYNNKIRLMVALAPVAFIEHMPNVGLKLVARYHLVLDLVASLMGLNEFMPSTKLMQILGQELCNEEAVTQVICSNIFFLIVGFDSQQLDKSMIPVILSNSPAGASTKQFIHYFQEVISGKFRQYDHGVKNIIIHGRLSPPQYDLSKVTAPIAIFYANNDLLVDEKDVDRLYKELPNPVSIHKVDFDKFNHLDFLWSIDVKPLLYDKVFDLLEIF